MEKKTSENWKYENKSYTIRDWPIYRFPDIFPNI